MKRRRFGGRKTASFSEKNEELEVLRLRFSSQKTSFSSEKTAFFQRWHLFSSVEDAVLFENHLKTWKISHRIICFAFLLCR